MSTGFIPVLSCAEARDFEDGYFGGDEEREWSALNAAGRALGGAVLADAGEIGGIPRDGRLLVLAGKGHNGGDALVAAGELLRHRPDLQVDVWLVYGETSLRPLAARALRELVAGAPAAVISVTERTLAPTYALVLDGIFGFQFRPPLDVRAAAAIACAQRVDASLRVAVDLPSGLDEPGAFGADFTYATGVVKRPLLTLPNAGRLRFLDLGFPVSAFRPTAVDGIVTEAVLAPLQRLRPAAVDKRSYGHLFVVGGSRSYPGAILMTVLAAVRSGVGLVTAFVPESLVPAFAAEVPEAMWVGWPETPEGGLALEGLHLITTRWSRATALVVGPGLARERETLTLAAELVGGAGRPVLIDADALQPEVVEAVRGPVVLTPHAGEYARIAGGTSLESWAALPGRVTVLKGPTTRVAAAGRIHHSFFGGPVLARGGSGDLLAGLIGGQLAQTPAEPVAAALRGVVWHGRAADRLARSRGAVAVRTTELLGYL